MAELLECPTCEKSISSNATSCPHCGESNFFSFEERGTEKCPSCKNALIVIGCDTCGGSKKLKKILKRDERTGLVVDKFLVTPDGDRIEIDPNPYF